MDIQTFKKKLKDNKLSITKNKLKIFECLNHAPHFHSINDIIKHIPNFNVKSIYNNIRQMIDASLIDIYQFNGISKYALNGNIQKPNEIHLVKDTNIKHFSLSKPLFNSLKKELEINGVDVDEIKIFVKVKK